MASSITSQQRERYINFLKEHPVNPVYDEVCDTLDANPPEEQLLARMYKKLLDDSPDRFARL